MKKSSLLLLIHVICIAIAVTLGYKVRCPDAGEWRFRGRKFNCGTTQYVCLFHSLRNINHENCDGLDYSSIGSKLIFEPSFNKALCNYNRYQPFPFSTDGSSKYVFQKSFCNEKGQYVFHKGSLKSDITCGCDLSSGYHFVSKPKNTCFCVPSEEDCSCHKLHCYDKEEQCPLDNDVIKTKR
ncbi:uncharacterized protein LOC127711152 isoform X2 [Mytilus californianus]|nr:uncharacterized protein LOC127711152 isoform X2 [Mytilus californianus]